MKSILLLLLLISGSISAQQVASKKYNYNDFNLIVRVEDQEKYYNNLLKENPIPVDKLTMYSEYRAQLAINWLAKGNIEKFNYYMRSNPKFTILNLLNITYALEHLVDEGKHSKAVEEISRNLLEKLNKGILADGIGRTQVLWEVNALANARLGNLDMAMKNIADSDTIKISSRYTYYNKDAKANYLTRYSLILSAAGENKRALDTLTKALRNADSNPRLAAVYKEIYKKMNGSYKGADQQIKLLQNEAYQKYYKEMEKLYISRNNVTKGLVPSTRYDTVFTIFQLKKPIYDISLTSLNGNVVKLGDYKGKILVVDFWTTVCTPCIAAFSAFERVVEHYKKDPFQLFVIDVHEPLKTVQSLVTKKNITLDVLHDESNEMFTIRATPTKIISDPEGNIRFYSVGYAGSTDREYYKFKAMVEIVKARANGGTIRQSK